MVVLGISMRCGFLDIPQGDTGIQGGGDERVPERVWGDVLVDPSPFRQPFDDPGGGMPIQPAGAVVVEEDRAVFSFPDTQVDGPGGAGRQRDGDDFSSFAGDGQSPMTPLHTKLAYVGIQRFRDAQPVQRQQTRQRMVPATTEAGLDQEHAQFVAIHTGGMGFVVETGATHMSRRGHWYQLFLETVSVEPGYRR
jgi:hypothetical protein